MRRMCWRRLEIDGICLHLADSAGIFVGTTVSLLRTGVGDRYGQTQR